MKKQKNKFLLFVFSLCPGAGHMYMGLMKMGLSFMLGFMGLVAVVGITEIAVLSVFPVTLYIYAFFHVNNIGGMDAAQFAALEDEYLFGIGEWDTSRFKLNMNKRNRNIAAVVCIVIGICMLWDSAFGMVRSYVGWDNPIMREIYYFTRNELPRIIIAVAIIWFGVSLLRGKKFESAEVDRRVEADVDRKPATLPGESVGERKADAENADGQSADVEIMGEQKPAAEASKADMKIAEEQKAYGQNAEVHNVESQSDDAGKADKNERGGE